MRSLRNISDITALLIVLYLIYLGGNSAYKILGMITPWYTVEKIHVDDFKQEENSNRVITYKRFVHKDFTADWFVQIINQNEGEPQCHGSGKSRYKKSKEKKELKVTVEWFVGKKCNLKPGQYKINTIWVNEDGRSIQSVSNAFNVS